VYENSATWRFASDVDRAVLVAELVPMLDRVVVYAYGMGDDDNGGGGSAGAPSLTACFHPAAAYVVDAFVTPSAGSLRFQAVLGAFASTFRHATPSTFLPFVDAAVAAQFSAVATFVRTLFGAAAHRGVSTAALERRLFKAATLVARLSGVASPAFCRPALDLVEVLVRTAAAAEAEPPSLLGHVGIQTSRSFLQTLARLAAPVRSSAEQAASWRLFTAIVAGRQQWMANCLLTGKTPRDGLRSGGGGSQGANSAATNGALPGDSSGPSPDSVLVAALANVAVLATLPPDEALATLEFVATALNHWPRTVMVMTGASSSRGGSSPLSGSPSTGLFAGLEAHVRGLRSPAVTARTDAVQASVEARLAAYAAQIFAMQLHHLRQMGKGRARAAELVKDLDYYLRDAAVVGGYNASLHANFAKNFADRYPGCSLDAFKRTAADVGGGGGSGGGGPHHRRLGTGFYYDLERANDMLRFDPSWVSRRGNGFRSEMELANANLSLVDAQVVSVGGGRSLRLFFLVANARPRAVPLQRVARAPPRAHGLARRHAHDGAADAAGDAAVSRGEPDGPVCAGAGAGRRSAAARGHVYPHRGVARRARPGARAAPRRLVGDRRRGGQDRRPRL
jgi:nuclear pore complex protein Nup188